MNPETGAAIGQFIPIAQYTILGTAILVALGGIMGFVKAKSKASLIAGVISGILLAVSFFVTQADLRAGLVAATVLLFLLDGMFASRLAKTKKFMPSGMMLVICSIAEVIVIVGLLQAVGVIQ
jgi:uncharacterized membrane protein (UPF0136 family)